MRLPAHLLTRYAQLPFSTTSADVNELFSADISGSIVKAEVATSNGRSRGYATVLFEKEDDAQAAVETFNGAEVGGRSIEVRFDRMAEKAEGVCACLTELPALGF